MVFLLARYPDRLEATHPQILDLIENDRQDAVNAIITMLEDFTPATWNPASSKS